MVEQDPPSSRNESASSSAHSVDGSHSSRVSVPRNRAGQNVCVFWLGGHRYALDAVHVAEVVAVPGTVPVPLTPPWLLGLCNLRGTALVVIDLPAVLGLPETFAADPERSGLVVLVLRVHGLLVGARIDRVEAVYRFDAAHFEATPARDEHPAVRGLLEFGERGGFLATLLDDQEIRARLKDLRFERRTDGGS
jgi:chemotaxis signal transduction protein